MRIAVRLMAGALAVLAALLLIGTVVTGPPAAQATSTQNCETVLWGFLGSQRRTICDGPVTADGSWMRRRQIWVPEHYVPLTTTCYGGRYWTNCNTYGGYWVNLTVVADETYPVTPDTVLPDEPGYLSSEVLR